MKGIIWLWKHRKRRVLRRSELPAPKPGESSPFLTKDGQLKPGLMPPSRPCRVPAARQWKVSPPPAPPMPNNPLRDKSALLPSNLHEGGFVCKVLENCQYWAEKIIAFDRPTTKPQWAIDEGTD